MNQATIWINQLDPQFHSWKEEVAHISTAETEFTKWLFIQVASVLFADKSGELLTMPHGQFGLSIGQRIKHTAQLARRWGCCQMLLSQSQYSVKIIFYRPERVQAALDEIPNYLWRGRLGYAATRHPITFLAEVGRRWRASGEIPHEIGLALGYPTRDVLGFMNLLPLEFIGACGWRVYDDLTKAMRRSEEYMRAKQMATVFLAI